MKHLVKIVFGQEAVIQMNKGIELSDLDMEISVKEYSFKTKAEKDAFILGLDEAVGWTEYSHFKISKKVL